MKFIANIVSGFIWNAVAALIAGFAGGSFCFSDAKEVAPIFLAPSIITSAFVTWLYRKQLFVGNPVRNYKLPFLTIITAVPIFVTTLYLASVVWWMFDRLSLGSPMDGYLFAIITGTFLSISVALPITYPITYPTQLFIGWSGKNRFS
jgi:hypothetical protein